jgi:hypothetical protein
MTRPTAESRAAKKHGCHLRADRTAAISTPPCGSLSAAFPERQTCDSSTPTSENGCLRHSAAPDAAVRPIWLTASAADAIPGWAAAAAAAELEALDPHQVYGDDPEACDFAS